jgi:PhnB protein
MMNVNPLPEGTQPLVPYLMVENAAKAIEYYKEVFMAEEGMKMTEPDGKKVMHAELRIAGCTMYIADACEDRKSKRSKNEGHQISLTLYCLDADKVYARALEHGAKSEKPMEDAFWGDRYGSFVDPFGHMWTVMTRKEELSVNEVMERGKKAMAHA